MIRTAMLAVSASVLAGCTVVAATPRSFSLIEQISSQPGEVLTYASLSDVRGPMEVLGEIEIANENHNRSEIEQRLRNLAAKSGANAIVLHENNRWKLGAAYTSAPAHTFDPFQYSRATAIRVLAGTGQRVVRLKTH